MVGVSLTSKLRSGIVKDWFGVRFPNTQRFCMGANRELRDGATTVPCAIPRPQGSDASLVGQAVGYVLTAHLQETALDVSFAVTNVVILNRLWKNLQVDATDVARRAVQRIHELKLIHPMGSADWNELCRLALVLGRLEQGGRNVTQVGASVAQELARSKSDLDAFIGAFAAPATVTDLSALGRVAVDDHIELRKARQLHIGPTFAQSHVLGGADADIICDGQLIDFKSSAQAKVIGRRDAWQLVGYLLADTPDLYHIRKAGFAALRRRRTALWGAQELLDELSGRPASGIADLRAEFHDLLELAARGDKDLSKLQFRENRQPISIRRTEP